MFRKSIFGLLIIILISALLLQACASSEPIEDPELPDLGTIKVGYLPTSSYAPYYLGVEKGYFEEQGLTVELERFVSGSQMIAPLSAGQLDAGAGNPSTSMFNGAQQGLDMKVVCGLAAMTPGHYSIPFLVRTDLYESGEVIGPADLQGKKIGVNVLRGNAEYIVAKVLEKGGLSVDATELVTLAFPDTPVALANGALDAAILPSLLANKTIKDGSAVVLLEGDEIGGDIQTAVMYFGKRFVDPANKEIAVRFLMAYLKGLRELMDENWSDEENLNIISKYTNLPPDLIQSSVKSYNDPNCEFIFPSLEDYQDYYISRGYTDYSEPLPLSNLIDEIYKDEAVRRLGEYQE